MKIAIVGCGAVGSYYGAQLCRAGAEVHFLLRSDYEPVRQRGVLIHTPKGDFSVRPNCAVKPEQIGPCDLVVIALKTTANDRLSDLLPPLVGADTALLTLQNGLGNEEALAKLFPAERILGGLCFVCLNRIAPGVIRHTDHGQIVIGEFQRFPLPRTHKLAAMFRDANVPCEVSEDLARAHWEKLVWNIPFNGLGVGGMAGYDAVMNPQSVIRNPQPGTSCLSTDVLLADPRWARLLRELMDEVIATANAIGLPVRAELTDKMMALTHTMGAYKASTLLDFEKGLPLELNGLFLEPLRLAQQAGCRSPRLAAICRVLCHLDALREHRSNLGNPIPAFRPAP